MEKPHLPFKSLGMEVSTHDLCHEWNASPAPGNTLHLANGYALKKYIIVHILMSAKKEGKEQVGFRRNQEFRKTTQLDLDWA